MSKKERNATKTTTTTTVNMHKEIDLVWSNIIYPTHHVKDIKQPSYNPNSPHIPRSIHTPPFWQVKPLQPTTPSIYECDLLYKVVSVLWTNAKQLWMVVSGVIHAIINEIAIKDIMSHHLKKYNIKMIFKIMSINVTDCQKFCRVLIE